ncbi:BnaC06g05140D [Brassica napus]|uniref:(rape) hypothetical protein n=1 Tax=Brassica napus TaxID=3708 RepID=A0A078IEP5_BRANA|nr:unnamed protein product [Brassica napus]CDY47829.1 BnaC06g05140D [Brassica napus]
MLAKKKKPRTPLALSFKPFRLARASSKSGAMAKKKNKSISLADLGVAAIGASAPPTDLSSLAISGSTQIGGSGSAVSLLTSTEALSSTQRGVSPPPEEASNLPSGSGSALPVSKVSEEVANLVRNYAALLKSSAQLQEFGTPSEHVSVVSLRLLGNLILLLRKLSVRKTLRLQNCMSGLILLLRNLTKSSLASLTVGRFRLKSRTRGYLLNVIPARGLVTRLIGARLGFLKVRSVK